MPYGPTLAADPSIRIALRDNESSPFSPDSRLIRGRTMMQSCRKLTRWLTFKWSAALALIGALAAANYFILRAEILDNQTTSTILSQVGRQRVLVYRTAMLCERMMFSFDEAERGSLRSEILKDVNLLEDTHRELMFPDSRSHGELSKDAKSIYESSPWLLDSELRNYALHVRALAATTSKDLNFGDAHFKYIRNPETIDKIRKGLDKVVAAQELQSIATSTGLGRLASWTLASTIVLLLANGWLVFRPMVNRVRTDVVQLNNLNETLEERVAVRTAEAERRAEQLAKSEAALRESEALYSSLVHHLPMSVVQKDRDGRIVFANDRFCDFLEVPRDRIVGHFDREICPAERFETFQSRDRRVMTTGHAYHDVERRIAGDGRERFVEVLTVPYRNAGGVVTGTQTLLWDVTERKLAEKRALQTERLAAIGQMVTGVAHESRNALQQIRACSQLLRWRLKENSAEVELLVDLQRAEERLLHLFDELRGYAAPAKLRPQRVDIRQVLSNAWESTLPLREERDAALCEVGECESPECWIDPFQVEQVFRNLFENALAACGDPVRIDVVIRNARLSDGPGLEITVHDNGPGLTEEARSRIFEPFFTTKTQGTGLGMAIVKRIVEAHGGEIIVRSDEGASVIVTLPANAARTSQPANNHQYEARLV